MRAQAQNNKTDRTPTERRGGRRKRVSKETKQDIIQTALSNPNLSHEDLAKINEVSRPFVTQLLIQQGINKDQIKEYKAHEADLLTALRARIYTNITDEEIKKAPFGSKILAFCQIYDKYRLETDQSTDNQAVLVTAINDLRAKKRLRNGEHSQEIVDDSE